MIRIARALPLFVLVLASSAACRRPRPPVTPPPTVNEDSVRMERERMERERAERERAEREQAERERMERERAERERQLTEARNAVTAAIYFDFDRAELSDEARSTLDAKVPVLQANDGLRIRVGGHTDERGSDEYNLALGQRRAAAAKRYLVQRGIAADRIEIVSYGEERPAAQGSDESAWSQNRRDEFEIIAGGDVLIPARQ